jgi:lipoyl(octanoyl) transferase
LQGRVENVLLLLEHPPVLTLGRNANRANVLASDELLAQCGVTLHEINRGGDVTYHGPGQLVGYPIFDLRSLRNRSGSRMGPVDFVRQMEEALIRLCSGFGVQAGRICGLTGVWCGVEQGSETRDQRSEASSSTERCAASGSALAETQRKIAAIGIHVSRGITTHGFALNVTTDLRDFELIVPCGIVDHAVTSLAEEMKRTGPVTGQEKESLPGLEAVAHEAARQFGLVLDQQVLAVESLEALREQADTSGREQEPVSQVSSARPGAPTSGMAAREFPAEDTPMRVPPEVERLRHKEGRPVQA